MKKKTCNRPNTVKHATNTTNQQNLRPRSRHKASPASKLSWALCGDSWSRTLGELARMLHKVRRTQSESNSHKKATNNLGSDRPGKRKIYNQHKQGQITNSRNPQNEKLICSQFNHERTRNQHQGALEKVEVNKGSQISQYSTVALKLIIHKVDSP